MKCPTCGTPLEKREGRFGDFFFCPGVYTKQCVGYTISAKKLKEIERVTTQVHVSTTLPPRPNWWQETPSHNRQCEKHGTRLWVESVPAGAGYCRACVNDEYQNAARCPHCGIKYGFAPGTGDCGCETDYDVGF